MKRNHSEDPGQFRATSTGSAPTSDEDLSAVTLFGDCETCTVTSALEGRCRSPARTIEDLGRIESDSAWSLTTSDHHSSITWNLSRVSCSWRRNIILSYSNLLGQSHCKIRCFPQLRRKFPHHHHTADNAEFTNAPTT